MAYEEHVAARERYLNTHGPAARRRRAKERQGVGEKVRPQRQITASQEYGSARKKREASNEMHTRAKERRRERGLIEHADEEEATLGRQGEKG